MLNIIDSMVHDCIATTLPKKGPMPGIVIDWGVVNLSKTEFEYVNNNINHTTYPSGRVFVKAPKDGTNE